MEGARRHGLRRGDPLTGTAAPAAARGVVLAPRRFVAPLVTGAALAGWAIALRLRDPHVAGSWGTCPFLQLTGRPCPACGGLRAVNDLLHGDVVAAVSSNALVVAVIPVALWFWVQWLAAAAGRRPPVGSGPVRMWAVWGSLGLALVFSVVRNLPFGAWLAP